MNSGSGRNTFVEAVLVHVPVHIQVFPCRERELSLRVLVGSIEGVVAVGTAGDAQDRDDAPRGDLPRHCLLFPSGTLWEWAQVTLSSPCPQTPVPACRIYSDTSHLGLLKNAGQNSQYFLE